MLRENDITAGFPWGPETRITTKRGERLVRRCRATPEADAFYYRHENDCVAHGVQRGEWPKGSGKFNFTWWKELPKELREHLRQSEDLSRQTSAEVAIPCPAGREYLPYQKAGIAYIIGRNGTLLGDEMGLGKTIQIIGAINADPKVGKALIVCPSGLVLNWQRELMRWLVRPMDVATVDGETFPSTDVVVIGWGMLTKWRSRLETTYWDFIGVDEAHYMKNPAAQRSQVILGYKPRRDEPAELAKAPLTARRRVASTGTPICNQPRELWPLVNWLDPINWRDWWKFHTRYCGLVKREGFTDTSGASNLDELQRELRRTVMVRRLKKDVLTELPPKTRQIVVLEDKSGVAKAESKALAAGGFDLEGKLAELKAQVELARAGDSVGDYERAVARLAEGVKLPFEAISKIRHESALAKVPAALDAIREDLETADKVVVFAHHVDVLKKLIEGLEKFRPAFAWGDHSTKEKQAAVDRFQNDPKCRVFIGGTIPMGTGFTLTAAALVIFVELDWVPGVMLQAEDRLHRIGQTDNVLVKHLVVNGTIDSRFCEILLAKMSVIEQALDKRHEEKAGGFYRIEKSEPVVPIDSVSTTRAELEEAAAKISPRAIAATLRGLRALRMICDGAFKLDGAGFSKVDQHIGRSLADQLHLSPKQAALGQRLVRKYRRQLPPELVAEAIGETTTKP
jgi:SWI/SNF-related matrix-associated actin-dependent regulator 1 of chromatin subfamily A